MRGYRLLLTVNAAAMAAAVLLLVHWPDAFGRLIGMQLSKDGLILAHLLGASEFAFATLCLFGVRAGNRQNMRMVSTTCGLGHSLARGRKYGRAIGCRISCGDDRLFCMAGSLQLATTSTGQYGLWAR